MNNQKKFVDAVHASPPPTTLQPHFLHVVIFKNSPLTHSHPFALLGPSGLSASTPCSLKDSSGCHLALNFTADSSKKEQEVDFIMQENIPIASSSLTELRAEVGKRSFIIPENLLETKLQITRTCHTMKNSFSPFTKDETELWYHSKTSSPTLAAVVAAGSVKTPP